MVLKPITVDMSCACKPAKTATASLFSCANFDCIDAEMSIKKTVSLPVEQDSALTVCGPKMAPGMIKV